MSRKIQLMFDVCVVDDEITSEALLKNCYDMLITCGCNFDWGGAFEPYTSQAGNRCVRRLSNISEKREVTNYVKE
jgi:hypothetical protein